MIDFLINDNGIRQTLPALESMIKNTDDDVLVLAYGYTEARILKNLNIADWLNHFNKRRIVLIFGIQSAKEADNKNSNGSYVEEVIEQVLEKWFLPSDAHNRVLLYAVEHFHAKFAATGRSSKDSDIVSAFSFDAKIPLMFHPTEVIIGSSNLTKAALQGPNIELDTYISRDCVAELGQFASKLSTLLTRAIARTNEEGTYSQYWTEQLRGYLDRRIDILLKQRAQKEYRDMEAYSQSLERRLMDPDT